VTFEIPEKYQKLIERLGRRYKAFPTSGNTTSTFRYDPHNPPEVISIAYTKVDGTRPVNVDGKEAIRAIDDLLVEVHKYKEKIDHLEHVIDRDRYVVAAGLTTIIRALRSYAWLVGSRGPYDCDDDDYRKEFSDVVTYIETALDPLRKVAWDKSDCTDITERVIRAKEAANEILKSPPVPRMMIEADLGLPSETEVKLYEARIRISQLEAEVQKLKGD